MSIPVGILKVTLSATSFTSATDIFATDISLGSQTQGVSNLVIDVTLGTGSVLSLITKKASTASVIGSSQFNSGTALTANAAYTFVKPMNVNHVYNMQVAATSTIMGSVFEVQSGLI